MLLKEGVDINHPEEFIDGFSPDKIVEFDKGEVNAIMYMDKKGLKTPDWAKSFATKIGGVNLADIVPKNQSCGVSLFIEVQNRIFAINWGRLARFYINKLSIDQKFGIYTANKCFNLESETKLKSAQSRVNQTNPINKQRQYGESVSNDELHLAMEDNEALRELTVFNLVSDDFHRLIGKYSSLNVQFIFDKEQLPCLEYLPGKLQVLLEIYNSVEEEDVRKLFKGIFPKEDQLDELFLELENCLVNNASNFSLFEPQIDFDFSSISQFKINTASAEKFFDNFSLSNYLSLNTSPNKNDLESDTICVIDEDGRELKEWNILDCLYGEVEYNGTNYILSHGTWFEVNVDKYNRITDKIEDILDDSFIVSQNVKDLTKASIAAFVPLSPKHKPDKERMFNNHLCSELLGYLFDEPSKQINLYEDKFEVCDIFLADDQRFLHVKKNDGASALSHLFNQGFVSASAYAKFKNEYADKVNAFIPNASDHIADQIVNPCVHYLIINEKKDNRLTFFSKMALEDRVSTLEAMGFTVKLSWVQGVYS